MLTYNQPSDALASSDSQISGAMAGIAAQLGEPFISRFRRAEIAELLHHHGFGDIIDFGPDEARAAYFGGRPDAQIAGPSGWSPLPWHRPVRLATTRLFRPEPRGPPRSP